MRFRAAVAVPRPAPVPLTRYMMSTWSTMTVGTFAFARVRSATAVRLLCLPEVDEPADAGEQRPAQGPGPHVRRQLPRGEAVDQREPHQVDVDGGRVGLEQH